jgi:hypothetical protein
MQVKTNTIMRRELKDIDNAILNAMRRKGWLTINRISTLSGTYHATVQRRLEYLEHPKRKRVVSQNFNGGKALYRINE